MRELKKTKTRFKNIYIYSIKNCFFLRKNAIEKRKCEYMTIQKMQKKTIFLSFLFRCFIAFELNNLIRTYVCSKKVKNISYLLCEFVCPQLTEYPESDTFVLDVADSDSILMIFVTADNLLLMFSS